MRNVDCRYLTRPYNLRLMTAFCACQPETVFSIATQFTFSGDTLLMLDFFISPAMAQDAGAAGSGMAQIIMLVGFVAIFYFLLWRPQSKRAKQHRELVSGLAKGDEVIIGG